MALVLGWWLVGCAAPQVTPDAGGVAATPAASSAATKKPSRKSHWARLAEDPRVGVYTSTPWSFSTNAFWIEGPEGVVLVETQFLPSAAEELLRAAEETTGKKVVGAIVLHANPDKFNGTATLQARGIKVVTSQQVLDLIPEVHEKRVKAFYDRYKPDYPAEQPTPESFGAESTTVQMAGVEIGLHVMGPGCSAAHVVATFDGHLFAGDLVASGAHSWLEIGQGAQWLQRVDEMEALTPTMVHPGRGPSGGPELLTAQRQYLQTVMALIDAERPTLPVDDDALGRVADAIKARYPDHRFAVFLKIGLPAQWRAQATAPEAP